tara:strand:- start:1971 stop:2651 length:681 start_codon:yes stop_codon:yes gene_type:complete
MIDKYIAIASDREWKRIVMNWYEGNRKLSGVIERGDILKLINPEGVLKEFTVNSTMHVANNKLGLTITEERKIILNLTYDQGSNKITITNPYTLDEYILWCWEINPVWLKLQLAKKKLAFAMSLNERLGKESLMNYLDPNVITLIGENIVDPPKVDPPEVGPPEVDPPKEDDGSSSEGEYDVFGGGGVRLKKKKRKSKKKRKKTRKKTRKKKSKRKKHKTKRRRKS